MAFCLDFHASYRCRHVGACCTQDWHIPVEARLVELVGSLGMAGAQTLAGGAALPRHPSGACVFFDADAGHLCRIHTAAGLDALPSACRHFPRVVLHDDRGVFISLSHFCPTAAGMLLDGGAEAPPYTAGIRIVEAPASLDIGHLEGFDARGALPPLLRPGVLTDLAGYHAWEGAAIQMFAHDNLSAAHALDMLEAATRRIRAWRPGSSSLSDAVAEAFHAPPVMPRQPQQAEGEAESRAVNRYLAARLFATPLAYEAQGLLTIVEWLRTCLTVLEREAARGHETGTDRFIEAVRRADLVLVHQTDTRAFCRHAARAMEGARP